MMGTHAAADTMLPPDARPAQGQGRTSALVVDDEAPARDELAYLLRTFPDIGIVHAVGSSSAAIRHLQQHQYDLVFLDVRMPDLDGLEVAQLLQQFAIPPVVIFVTAYEEYAVRAFDVQARDYLLKPISRARLERALQHALVMDRTQTKLGPEKPAPAIPVEVSGRTRMIECRQVSWVEAVGDYVRLHLTDGSAHLIRMPISHVEERWSSHGFVRIHRARSACQPQARTRRKGTIPARRRRRLRSPRDRPARAATHDTELSAWRSQSRLGAGSDSAAPLFRCR
jgi:two-component system response regulator LytT